MPDAASTPAAERQRRRRERKRRGLVLARAEVPDQLVEALVEKGVLPGEQAADPHAIGQALVTVTEEIVTP